jgi:hypothetical protein
MAAIFYSFFLFLQFWIYLLVCIEPGGCYPPFIQLQPYNHRSGEFPFLEHNKVLGCFG